MTRELAIAVKEVGYAMDHITETLHLQALANFGNYLWFRLQVKNCEALKTEPDMARALKQNEQECVKYKALLPKEWQW